MKVLFITLSLLAVSGIYSQARVTFDALEENVTRHFRLGNMEEFDKGVVQSYMRELCNRNLLGDQAFSINELGELLRLNSPDLLRFINEGNGWGLIQDKLKWLMSALHIYSSQSSDKTFCPPSQVKARFWKKAPRQMEGKEMESIFLQSKDLLLMPFSARETKNIQAYLVYLSELSSTKVVREVLHFACPDSIECALRGEDAGCKRVYECMLDHYRGSKEPIPYSRLVIEKQRELDARPKPAPKESWVPRWIGGCFGLMSADGEGYAAHHTSGYTRAPDNIPADQRPLLTSGADKKRD